MLKYGLCYDMKENQPTPLHALQEKIDEGFIVSSCVSYFDCGHMIIKFELVKEEPLTKFYEDNTANRISTTEAWSNQGNNCTTLWGAMSDEDKEKANKDWNECKKNVALGIPPDNEWKKHTTLGWKKTL